SFLGLCSLEGGLQLIVDDRPARRILADRRPAGKSWYAAAPKEAISRRRFEENCLLIRVLCRVLAQRSDVIQHPEGSAVRRDDQIIVVHYDIVHGGLGKVSLQRLPMCAIVERNENTFLGCGEEETSSFWIFADSMHKGVLRKVIIDAGPALAEVRRLVDVGS